MEKDVGAKGGSQSLSRTLLVGKVLEGSELAACGWYTVLKNRG